MSLAKRLARLEQARGAQLPDQPDLADLSELGLAPDILQRIAAAHAAGTCPQSLSDSDLEAVIAAYDKAMGIA
jgi:hypothetical protein